MSYFTKSRIYIFLIILLAVLNLGLIVFFWKGPMSKAGRHGGPFKLEYFLERRLDLTQEQMEEYRQLRQTHFRKVDMELREMRRLKGALFDLVGGEANDEKKENILEQIGKTQVTIDSLTFSHFESLRRLCNDEQQRKFDDVIKEVMHRLGRKGPPPGGRRRRP
ncbi:hypothetical protein QQ020_24770 [Fulvivirgaceae bacterium BMA12]|uniref:Periplasmic heavy metal sensor n=1 Tax=Agaribacillus aureus TaxID=3051825 RepID=A0ABT8LG28_9BACT|nr:hypothetical protein [Fulvivirgaceae bacterium BMA12]